MTELPRLRLQSDHGCALWVADGGTEPEILGLSEELAADINAWQEIFDSFFDVNTGWILSKPERDHTAAAPSLGQRLADELCDRFEVEVVTDIHGVPTSTAYRSRGSDRIVDLSSYHQRHTAIVSRNQDQSPGPLGLPRPTAVIGTARVDK